MVDNYEDYDESVLEDESGVSNFEEDASFVEGSIKEEEPIAESIPADILEEEVTKIDETNYEFVLVAFVTDRLDGETRTLISDKLLDTKDKVLKGEPYDTLRGVADFQSWSGDFDKGYVDAVTMDGSSYRFSFKLDSDGKLSKVEYQD